MPLPKEHEGGHKSPPKEYAERGATKPEHYADPRNCKYPIHGKNERETYEFIRAAIGYFCKPENYKKYPPDERRTVARRILDAAEKAGAEVGETLRKLAGEKVAKAVAVMERGRWVLKAFNVPVIEKAPVGGGSPWPKNLGLGGSIRRLGPQAVGIERGADGGYYVVIPKPMIEQGPRGGYITGYGRRGQKEYGGVIRRRLNVTAPEQITQDMVSQAFTDAWPEFQQAATATGRIPRYEDYAPQKTSIYLVDSVHGTLQPFFGRAEPVAERQTVVKQEYKRQEPTVGKVQDKRLGKKQIARAMRDLGISHDTFLKGTFPQRDLTGRVQMCAVIKGEHPEYGVGYMVTPGGTPEEHDPQESEKLGHLADVIGLNNLGQAFILSLYPTGLDHSPSGKKQTAIGMFVRPPETMAQHGPGAWSARWTWERPLRTTPMYGRTPENRKIGEQRSFAVTTRVWGEWVEGDRLFKHLRDSLAMGGPRDVDSAFRLWLIGEGFDVGDPEHTAKGNIYGATALSWADVTVESDDSGTVFVLAKGRGKYDNDLNFRLPIGNVGDVQTQQLAQSIMDALSARDQFEPPLEDRRADVARTHKRLLDLAQRLAPAETRVRLNDVRIVGYSKMLYRTVLDLARPAPGVGGRTRVSMRAIRDELKKRFAERGLNPNNAMQRIPAEAWQLALRHVSAEVEIVKALTPWQVVNTGINMDLAQMEWDEADVPEFFDYSEYPDLLPDAKDIETLYAELAEELDAEDEKGE